MACKRLKINFKRFEVINSLKNRIEISISAYNFFCKESHLKRKKNYLELKNEKKLKKFKEGNQKYNNDRQNSKGLIKKLSLMGNTIYICSVGQKTYPLEIWPIQAN